MTCIAPKERSSYLKHDRKDYAGFHTKQSPQRETAPWHKPKDRARPFLVITRPALTTLEQEKFFERVALWHAETDGLSATEDIISHAAFLEIIVAGKKILPLLLREFKENGGRWFRALELIAEFDPVAPEDRGYSRKMRDAWIKWGQKNHYI